MFALFLTSNLPMPTDLPALSPLLDTTASRAGAI